MTRLSAPHTPELEDENAEIVRLEHERKIVEMQKLPAAALVPLGSLELADGIERPIPHPLGRRAFVWHSPPRGAVTSGRIEEVRASGGPDPAKYVVLKATGWGATITVDVAVL